MSEPAIAITGLGLVTPAGPDRESTWQGLLSGRSFTRLLDADPSAHCQSATQPRATPASGAPVASLPRLVEPWRLPGEPLPTGIREPLPTGI
ncbi:MAG: beta-ketoacyl synthase N-terminal-like domain-containing protein, partial [Planctomycetaceae bacterium]